MFTCDYSNNCTNVVLLMYVHIRSPAFTCDNLSQPSVTYLVTLSVSNRCRSMVQPISQLCLNCRVSTVDNNNLYSLFLCLPAVRTDNPCWPVRTSMSRHRRRSRNRNASSSSNTSNKSDNTTGSRTIRKRDKMLEGVTAKGAVVTVNHTNGDFCAGTTPVVSY